MKINLIDDTALIETTSTSIKNGPTKERTILGLRENLQPGGTNPSIANGRDEKIKTQESRGNMRMIRASATENKKRSLHVCGNVKLNQQIVENGYGKKNVNLGFGENVEIQENGKGIGEERKLVKFQENENVGFNFDGYGKKKVIVGCVESLKKKQESFNGNDCGEETKLMKIQENENVGFKKIQENGNLCLNGIGNSCGNEKGIMGLDTNQEKNGKTIQMWVARGKVQDKYATTFKDEKISTIETVEVQSGNEGGKISEGTKICYSRKQLEDLRFVNKEDQNKKWDTIYCELGPVVIREYEGLLNCNNHYHQQQQKQQQQPSLNINPQLDFKKKVTPNGICGPMAANGRWTPGISVHPRMV